jgi:hypothetical protein
MAPPKEPMILYYRITTPGSDNSNRSGITVTTSANGNPFQNNISNRFMCKSDFITPTTDIINFLGYRIPKNDDVGLPSTYLETLTIISKPYQRENVANMINATANYIDNGTTTLTVTPYVNYTVTGASGKFAGYKNIKIIYDKGGINRTVILS